ncbi:MAG: phosphohistidine phosphatase SixA [Methanoregula sp.]|nr:phosphohistidine phosphatase SixA [Methanoregula sp.]
MDLFILRHGKAEEASAEQDDSMRALTTVGRKEIRNIARWMRNEKFRFNAIATSPLMRAHETAGIIARILERKDRLVVWEDLAPGGDLDTVCYHAAQLGKDATVLVVGHEPGLSALLGRITSRDGTTSVIMAKGSLARIRDFSFEGEPSGALQWLLTAKQMQAML